MLERLKRAVLEFVDAGRYICLDLTYGPGEKAK
jgi:hypothetical protein